MSMVLLCDLRVTDLPGPFCESWLFRTKRSSLLCPRHVGHHITPCWRVCDSCHCFFLTLRAPFVCGRHWVRVETPKVTGVQFLSRCCSFTWILPCPLCSAYLTTKCPLLQLTWTFESSPLPVFRDLGWPWPIPSPSNLLSFPHGVLVHVVLNSLLSVIPLKWCPNPTATTTIMRVQMSPKSVCSDLFLSLTPVVSPEGPACVSTSSHPKLITSQVSLDASPACLPPICAALSALCTHRETSVPGHPGSDSSCHLWLLPPLKFHIQTVTKSWPALGCDLPFCGFTAAMNWLLHTSDQGRGEKVQKERDLTWTVT